MNFQEAVRSLEEGKQVIRMSWECDAGYLVLLPGIKNVWKIVSGSAIGSGSVTAGNNLFSVEDFLAEDWALLGTKKEEAAVDLGDENAN